MTAQLKPCTCGHRAHWRTGSHGGFLIKCDYCDASTGGSCTSLERAVENWNKSVELNRLQEVEKDSTDLHALVLKQHKEIRKLKDFIKRVTRICNATLDYHYCGTCLSDGCLLCEAERILKETSND